MLTFQSHQRSFLFRFGDTTRFFFLMRIVYLGTVLKWRMRVLFVLWKILDRLLFMFMICIFILAYVRLFMDQLLRGFNDNDFIFKASFTITEMEARITHPLFVMIWGCVLDFERWEVCFNTFNTVHFVALSLSTDFVRTHWGWRFFA